VTSEELHAEIHPKVCRNIFADSKGVSSEQSQVHNEARKYIMKRGGRQSVTLPPPALFGSSDYPNGGITIKMHRKKEVVPPPAASGTLGAALERSERRKQSAAESRE
jgi:hypothetical protein